jgi:hypothetical protein
MPRAPVRSSGCKIAGGDTIPHDYPERSQAAGRDEGAVTVLDVRRQNDYDADKVKLPGAVMEESEQLADGRQAPKERNRDLL